MPDIPPCPQCESAYAYQDREQFVCPECGNEWQEGETAEVAVGVIDANGNPLQNGDAVSIVKDLKIKGASGVLKAGTKVKNIRVLDQDHIVDGHDIDCKIDGFGAIKLKGSVVRRA